MRGMGVCTQVVRHVRESPGPRDLLGTTLQQFHIWSVFFGETVSETGRKPETAAKQTRTGSSVAPLVFVYHLHLVRIRIQLCFSVILKDCLSLLNFF